MCMICNCHFIPYASKRVRVPLQANLFLLLSLIGAGLYGEAKRRDAPPPTPPPAAYDEEAADSDSVPLTALAGGSANGDVSKA